MQLFSIGHSTRSLEQFVDLLDAFGIEALADVRSFPGSRRHPHFNQESLERELPRRGIQYVWLKSLGGRRSGGGRDSPNPGLRNRSFRAYADYMMSEQFRGVVEELTHLARDKRTAMMCAEAVYWRCHRRLISDYLMAQGIGVKHIHAQGRARDHELTPGGEIEDHAVTYPGEEGLFRESQQR